MAANVYTRQTVDGARYRVRRAKQGRKPSGLSKPELVRLYAADEPMLAVLKERYGYLYNRNQIIRDAVHKALSVYIELLNP